MASPQMLQEITEIFGEIVASDDKLVAECRLVPDVLDFARLTREFRRKYVPNVQYDT
jgi:hypothetical protein